MSARALLRHYPFLTPRASLLERLPAVPAGLRGFAARHGRIVGYHPGRDHVCASLYWFGDFDPWVDRTLARLARPGEVALDVGANIGATALALKRALGAPGTLVAFEPHPRNARLLRDNVAANRLSGVWIEELGLSDAEGTLELEEPAGQPGMARVREGAGAALRVRMRTLDAWLADARLPHRIAVCKIDVEGHEERAFAGMRDTLRAGRIEAFVLERHRPAADDPVLGLLAQAGYDLLRIEKSPLAVHYVELGAPPRARPTSDYVAVLRGGNARARLVN